MQIILAIEFRGDGEVLAVNCRQLRGDIAATEDIAVGVKHALVQFDLRAESWQLDSQQNPAQCGTKVSFIRFESELRNFIPQKTPAGNDRYRALTQPAG